MLKKLHILVMSIAAVFLLENCSADAEYDSTHRCYLYIDNSVRLDHVFNSCVDAVSSGTFCRISLGMKGGAQMYFLETNVNTKSEITLLADDKQRTQALGIYNESGVIVGYSNLPSTTDKPVFYAYDALCPNCYEANAVGRYVPMAMTDVPYGQCKCVGCGRLYSLNTGGIIVEGAAGKPLYRYHAETSGPNGFLKVYN